MTIAPSSSRGRKSISLAAIIHTAYLVNSASSLGSAHQPPPRVFSQKKSLAAGLGGNQGTKDLPLSHQPAILFSLPSSTLAVQHPTRHFYLPTHHTIGSLRSILSSTKLPEPSHTVGICQQGKHRQNTDRDTSSPVALPPRRSLWEHKALRASSTLNGLSADVVHRLAAWAPWAYQRFNFASGLT